MAWNLGIQRKLGSSRALEVRYNGNRTIHQWISINPNEVNVFENGFLKEFINAQSNLAICNANAAACVAAAGDPVGSARRYFSDLGLPGQVPVPIMTGAFTGSTTGPQNNPELQRFREFVYHQPKYGCGRQLCKLLDPFGWHAILLQPGRRLVRTVRDKCWLRRGGCGLPNQLLPSEPVCFGERDRPYD